jgi:Rps23 Pro-64 3,4-dihydroxylase Tpa1-like proline 4-hydroxylase
MGEAMSEYNDIYLEPECCADPETGQMWCQDPINECDEGVEWTHYILGDSVTEQLAEQAAELKWYKTSVEDGGGYFGTLAKANKELEAKIAEQAAEIKRLRGAFESIKDDYAFTQEACFDDRTIAYYNTACEALEPVKEVAR